jgi:hypothetical protein
MEIPKLHITLTERLEWICNILPDSHPSKLKKKLSTAIHQNNILISFVSVTLMETRTFSSSEKQKIMEGESRFSINLNIVNWISIEKSLEIVMNF